MFEKVSQQVSQACSRERSTVYKLCALCVGATVFVIVLPAILVVASAYVTAGVPLMVPRGVEWVLGSVMGIAGLALALWAVATFWFVGRGTPVLLAAPQTLVVSGPFHYCRNPMKLGMCCYYFGIGTIWVSLATGLLVFFVALACGCVYHKLIEEKELLLRYGSAYQEYRARTLFLLPWPFRKHQDT